MTTRNHPPTPSLDDAVLTACADRLRGPLIRPGDANYDTARRVWNGLIDKYPAAIARCTGVADVMACVDLARTHGVPVSVRGGGHNVAGTAVCDDGLVIDTSPMTGIRVDPDARTATVQPGAMWGALDRETQAFGLATPGGEVSQTGVAGLTLGGGLGWLRRKHGLSCDNLLSVDLVTPDGQFRRASETEHPDLFWALRGGGGEVGVVTVFTFRLHPVGPEVMYAGLLYPLDAAPDLLPQWRAYAETVPDEVTLAAGFWTIPAIPEMPTDLHGTPVLILDGVYGGPLEAGQRALQPLRDLGTPLLDLSGPTPYLDVQRSYDAFFPDGDLYYWKSLYLHALTDDATAFGDRSAPFHLSLDATWSDPANSDAMIDWVRTRWSDLQPYATDGFYVNFPGFWEEGDALQRAAYGSNYERLHTIKRRYDPDGRFARPASAGALS